ncbi:MAG: lytic transglycosylase domain-containing protein [Nitrospiraceae bacterium]|nr:lytic transglycosylase domain-containing protein [Nitrospiraceae bacterium]
MKRRAYLILAVCTAAAWISLPAQADIYQYVDEQGVVHFTNVEGGRIRRTVKVHRELPNPKAASAKEPSAESKQVRPDTIPASYSESINTACEKYGVDPSLVHAIIKVESDFNPFAISSKGAMGLMQLMPQTATDLNVKNSFSPHENIEGGVRYLRYLLDRYEGNLKLTLAAYNSGESAVKRWGTVPPFKETQDYVRRILAIYRGQGKSSLAPRYTIYVGYNPDGSLLLTDNPSNHPEKTLHRKMERNL